MRDLARRMGELERRVAALERRRAPGRAAPSSPSDLRQLEALRRRRGARYTRGRVRGVVIFAGAVRAGERESLWVRERGLAEIWDFEPQALARVLAALAHPGRLALARALVEAPRSSQELQQVIGAGSAGPLYHHLKEMVAAGLVHQVDRSRYEVKAEHTIPLLTLLAAAGDVLRVENVDEASARG